MAKYVSSIRGYVADVPELYFRRCDKRVFHYDQLTNFTMNSQNNDITINAGQDVYPVCTLPGSATMEMTATLGNFDASLFELAVAQNFTDSTSYQAMRNELLTIDATTHKITLSATPVTGTVAINGLEEATAVAEGKFVVDTAAKTVEFDSTESGDIEVSYETVESVKEIVTDNKASAVGTLYAIFPVYDDGSDCTESGIKGYVIIKVYRCRVTGKPSLAGQYKSARFIMREALQQEIAA